MTTQSAPRVVERLKNKTVAANIVSRDKELYVEFMKKDPGNFMNDWSFVFHVEDLSALRDLAMEVEKRLLEMRPR